MSLEHDLIDEYVDFASQSCDAPMLYHLAMGYFLSSTILGRYATIVTSYKPKGIKPNLWLMLIGPSRIVRKSTALELGEDILKEIDESVLLPASFSPEALQESLSQMERGSVGAWVKDELGEFFRGLKKKDYMAGTREIFSMIYMGRGETRKLRKLQFKVPSGIFITCAGTLPTPPHFYLSEEDFTSGFLNRFILGYAESRDKRIPILHTNPTLSTIRDEIIVKYKKLSKIYSEASPVIISFDSDSLQGLEDYDRLIEQELIKIEKDFPESLWKSYLAESPNQLMKMSVNRSLSRIEDRKVQIIVVNREDFSKAYNDLQLFLKSAKQVIDEVQTSAQPRPVETEERRINRIYSLIDSKSKTGASMSFLLLRSGLLKKDLMPILVTLVEQDRVRAILMRSRDRGRKPLMFFTANVAPQVIAGDVMSTSQLESMIK